MRIETQLKRRDSGKSALRSLYSHARHFGFPSKEMESRRHEILKTVSSNKAPQWIRQYLDGYWQALIDGAYERDLVFGGFYRGRFYSTHSKRADYYERNGISPHDFGDDGAVTARGHYWIESVDAGTPKAFFNMLKQESSNV